MTAEIIDMWLHRSGVRTHTPAEFGFNIEPVEKLCMYQPRTKNSVIDHNCPCQGCRQFFGTLEQPLTL